MGAAEPPGRDTTWVDLRQVAGDRLAERHRFRVGVLVAVSVAAVALLVTSRQADRVASEGKPSSGERWSSIRVGPLAPRISSSVIWTGTELIVWGGRGCGASCQQAGELFADGAAYDPSSDGWRVLAPSPLTARSGAVVAWTGKEMLIWGGSASVPLADGAAYDPLTDRWRLLGPGPDTGVPTQGVWTGRELVAWGRGAGVAYDPASDTWRQLSPAPLSPRSDVAMVWTGTDMLVWGGSAGGDYLADGAAYDPATDRWRRLSAAPLVGRLVRGSWSGRELLIWGGEASPAARADGAAYDPASDSWRPLAVSPLGARRGFAEAWTGHELIVWAGAGATGSSVFGDGAAYDPGTDRWRSMPRWPGRFILASVWTGRECLSGAGSFPRPARGRPRQALRLRRMVLAIPRWARRPSTTAGAHADRYRASLGRRPGPSLGADPSLLAASPG